MDKLDKDSIDDLFEIVSDNHGNHSITNVYSYVMSNIDAIPTKELVKRGAIADDSIPSLVAFYSTNLEPSNLFKKAKNATSTIGEAWASIVKNKAINQIIENYPPVFKGVNSEFVKELVCMSPDLDSINSIKEALWKEGIVLIFEQAIERSSVDGVAGKLPNGIPYIGMSLRLHRLDNFWFTLLHELGHIHLHYDKLDQPIIDSDEGNNTDEIEMEANQFALNSFIKRRVWNTSPLRFGRSDNAQVIRFAKEHSIHPAIVAGRIRKETNNYRLYNDLINQVDVRKIIWE